MEQKNQTIFVKKNPLKNVLKCFHKMKIRIIPSNSIISRAVEVAFRNLEEN